MNLLNKVLKRKKHEFDDAFKAQRYLLCNTHDLTIFDVGAYVGEVAAIYRRIFPRSTIFCFEPYPDSFQSLKNRFENKSEHLHRMALSDSRGSVTLHINSDKTCNSLFGRPAINFDYYPAGSDNLAQIEVETNTVDSFCDSEHITTIDILKLDVEGAELKVLRGAAGKLSNKQIRLIYCEVMFVPHYENGCLFHQLCDYLEPLGYTLYNLYKLRTARNGQLRWGNAIFVSPQVRKQIESI